MYDSDNLKISKQWYIITIVIHMCLVFFYNKKNISMSFEAENSLENIDTQTGSEKLVLIYINRHLVKNIKLYSKHIALTH